MAVLVKERERSPLTEALEVARATGHADASSVDREPRPFDLRAEDPWERQTGETSRQYLAFRCYRDIGPARSIQQAAAMYAEANPRVRSGDAVEGRLEAWSRSNRWVERAEAWDTYAEHAAREVSADLIAANAKKRFEVAGMLFDLVRQAIPHLKPDELSPRETADLARTAKQLDEAPTAAAAGVAGEIAELIARTKAKAATVSD